ncbi:MAG: PASTA domain-containing protein, partial [Armatimonadota bacterium]
LRKLQSGQELERTGVLPMPEGAAAAPPKQPVEPTPSSAQPATSGAPTVAPALPRRRPTLEAADEGVSLRGIAVVAFVAVVFVAAISYGLYRAAYPGVSVRRVQVPSVVGLTEAQAKETLAAAGLSLGSKTEQEDEVSRAGTIISQNPAFGEFTREDEPVDIVVAVPATVSVVTVPILKGMSEQQAREALEKGDLVLGATTREYSDSVAAGHVITQSIKGGSNSEKGTPIDIVVSKGPKPDEVVPPDVPPPANVVEPASTDDAGSSSLSPAVRFAVDKTWANAPGQLRVEVSIQIPGKAGRTHHVSIESVDRLGARVHQWDDEVPAGDREKTVSVYVPTGATLEVAVDGRLVEQWRAPET